MEPRSHYSYGVYKYGQGYWVRMFTAIMLGVLFLSASGWAWGQLTKISIPMPRWAFSAEHVDGKPVAGQSVALLRGSPAEKFGTAVIEQATPSGNNYRVTVGTIELDPNTSMLDAKQVETLGADGTRTFLASVASPAGIRVFNLIYLQVGVALLILVVGAWLTYYYVARNPTSVDFLIATDAEMRKVNWGTRKVILDSTWVVIGATFLIAGVIFLSDTLLSQFFRAIHVLGTR